MTSNRYMVVAALLTICMAGLCGCAGADVVTHAAIAPFSGIASVYGDSGDVFQNATVTADSGTHSSTDIRDLFTKGTPADQELVIFSDTDADPLSYVEFNVTRPYFFTKITIGLSNDIKVGAPDVRSIENVKIFARASAGVFTAQDLIADVDVDPEYTDAYGQRFLSLSIDLPSVEAQYFRVEFTEPLGSGYLDRGARVIEIDGFTAAVPAASAGFEFALRTDTTNQQRPNILFILTDDQGFPDVGINGHPIMKTPSMDRIATEGMRFTQFQACAECAPTRAGLMTGRNPFRVGVTCTFLGKYYLSEEQRTLADLLGDAGYQTAIIGKWHLGEHYPSRPQDKGFEYSFFHQGGALGPFQNVPWGQSYFDAGFVCNGEPVQTKGFATDVEIDTALGWLQQRDPDRPFFLYLPTSAPHSPYTPPPEDMQRFLDMGWNAHVAGFYGLIENLDRNLGRLLDYLDRSGLSENTLVVFMGDNGTSISHMPSQDDPQPLWNAGLKGGKSWGDEGGTRVPCFIRWPGKIQPGRVSDELAAYYDFLPTFLDVAGAQQLIPSEAEGVSLKSHLLDSQNLLPDRMICNIGHLFIPPTKDFNNVDYLNRISVRSKKFRYFRKNSLYDVQEDPGQTVNLAATYPEMLREMENAAARFWQESQAAALAPVHIHLGSPKEPVVMLTCVDWRPLTSGQGEAAIQPIAFWMGQGMSQQILTWQNQGVRPAGLEDKKEHLNGFWNVYFTRPGTYEFRATLTPPEVRDQVHLKEGTVWLKVNGEIVCEAPVAAGSQEAILRWNVEQPFRGEMQVVWSGQLPFDAELGAFVCDVERVGSVEL